MEYLFKNNILAKLVNSAEGDQPRGIMGETIRSMASMINLLDDRFLVHNAVHKPIVKLLRTCCAPGTELEGNESYHEDLVDLMYILCSKIHGYPELLNIFFYDKQWLTVPERIPSRRLQKNRETMALLRNMSHRSGLSSLGSPATSSSAASVDQNIDSLQSPTSSTTEVDPSSPVTESLSEFRNHYQDDENHDGKRDYEFLLFTYLSKFVHREGKSGDFARTGLLFLMELATGSLGEYILDSEFASYLTAGVGALYSQLPRKLIVKGGFESLTSSYLPNASNDTSGSNTDDNKDDEAESKPSRRTNIELSTSKDFQSRLDAFLKVLEFCQDVLMRCPNAEIATTLLASFKTVFLENVLYPSILECSDTDGSSVAVISYIDLILQVLEHEALVDLVVGFLMASEEDDTRAKAPEVLDAFAEVQNMQTTSPYFMATGRFTLKDLVLSRLKSRSQPTVIATLKLLNTVITRHCKYSLKLLTIQVDSNATSFSQLAEFPPKELSKDVPLINHHAHELDLFFALVATINPHNTADIFSNGYESYLRDAEGSVETHQCFLKSQEKVEQKVPGVMSEVERKKQRRRSMKYGHRMDLPDEQTGEAFLKEQEKIVEALSALSCCDKPHGTGEHPIQMHRLLPSDPLLQILLGTLSHFFAHSVELNLALTGVITSLAVCPYRSLEGWLLFRSTDIKRPAIDRGSEESSEIDSPTDNLSVGASIFAQLDAVRQSPSGDDSDDEETLPFYLSRGFNKTVQENPTMSEPPAFKSFPPFFTMLRTLTQQVDYYRSEIDGFDEYLADRRRSLLPPVEVNNTLYQSTGTLSESNTFNPGHHYGSSDSFITLTGDALGGQARPSTPNAMSASTSNFMASSGGAPTSPRHVASGGHSGPASRVTSPAPQRALSKTPVQGSSLANPVTMVKMNSPRARKSSSPSSLMSTPSNMSFLAPPGVSGKRNFKSNSASPLAVTRQPSGSNEGGQGESQQSQLPSRNMTTSPVPISQPRALWSPSASRPPVLGGMASAGGLSNASLPSLAASASQPIQNTSTTSFTLGGSSLAAGSNAALSGSSQLGSFGINSLSKIMDTMMIKPLFSDGFVNDSDSDAEEGLDIYISDDEEEGSSDREGSLSGEDDNDTDEADRELNSDLQEPRRKHKHARNKSNTGKVSKTTAATPQRSHRHHRGSSRSMNKKLAAANEKMITLTQLLTNVVILEEVVKEVVAIAQVRKGLGVDKVRFL